jgi:hypothetical protein
MKLPQTGGCLCGKIRYEISEAPRLVYTCHCTECQHLTSSAFSIALAVASFRLTGDEPQPLESTADSGRVKIRWVCPVCGCWLFSTGKPGDGLHRVRAGTLDDTSWLRPTMHFWTRSKQPWIMLPETIKRSRRSRARILAHAVKSPGRPAMSMPALGASRPLRRIPAIVSFLNPQPALSLVGGNRSSCPEAVTLR